jgi:hypothetical protein
MGTKTQELDEKTAIYDERVLKTSGLVEAGTGDDGEQLYIGTYRQWQMANNLQDKVDAMEDNEINQIIEETYE